MTVVFKGGTSGNREDHKAPTPSSGHAQPIQKTETHGSTPSTVHFQAENAKYHKDHIMSATPDFMPVGGTDSTGTDHSDPTATRNDNLAVFKNTPYTGIK
jgi:hypothetical protein